MPGKTPWCRIADTRAEQAQDVEMTTRTPDSTDDVESEGRDPQPQATTRQVMGGFVRSPLSSSQSHCLLRWLCWLQCCGSHPRPGFERPASGSRHHHQCDHRLARDICACVPSRNRESQSADQDFSGVVGCAFPGAGDGMVDSSQSQTPCPGGTENWYWTTQMSRHTWTVLFLMKRT